MRVDTTSAMRSGWATLGAAALIGVILLAFVGAGDGVGNELAQAKKEHDAKTGRQDFAALLREQRAANDELARTIERLKHDSGMNRSPIFSIPDTYRGSQPGYDVWRTRFLWVQDRIREKAGPRGRGVPINIDDLGFGAYAQNPAPDKLTPDLLCSLQVVHKAALIALSTKDSNFASIKLEPDLRPVLAGAKERPLLREYPLTLTVVGSLKDILWVLHRFSQVEQETIDFQRNPDPKAAADEEAAVAALSDKLARPTAMNDLSEAELALLRDDSAKRDFPLVLTGLVIDGENTNEKSDIQQLTATFKLAGMRFLSPQERGAAAAPASGAHPPLPVAGPVPANAPRPASTPARAPARGEEGLARP